MSKSAGSSNSTLTEEHILLALVKKYKVQIECIKTDTNRQHQHDKNTAWKTLTKEHNGISAEFQRNTQSISNKYENIKNRTKEKFVGGKRMRTGAGPEKAIVSNIGQSCIKKSSNELQNVVVVC